MSTDPPFRVPAHLFPVTHRFMDLGGARVHYVDEGSGETVLLLHGDPAWCFLYRRIIAALRADFRCVAMDYRGYGMSYAPPATASCRESTARRWNASSTDSR
jgi:haloalkane dehalogenase